MKVLLVNPLPRGLMRVSTPMSIGYIGSSVKKSGHEVKVLDECLKRDLLPVLEDFRPEVVGITGYSLQYPRMKVIAEISKSLGCLVVAGGIHCSAYPEYVLKDCGSIDCVVKGEGERSFTELLRLGAPTGIPGIFYRNSHEIEGTPPEFIEDLGSLPFPWDVLDPKDYSTKMPAGVATRYSPVASVLTSRGCPYGCTFCCASVVQGRKIRLRSVENILDEIELLVRTFGIKEIQIIDDNFSFYGEHILGVCRGIKARGLKLSWSLTNGIRADRVDRSILEEMKEAGCYYFAVGIESGSERVLKMISKGLSLDRVRETVSCASKMGFITQGFFMMGFPEETKEDREISSKFACSLDLDRLCVAPVMALPGSELFRSAYSDELEDYDWEQAGVRYWEPIVGAGSHSVIRKSISKMRGKFYLNPKRTIRHISKVRTVHQALGMVKGLVAVVKE